jgi:hypothetical protein
MNLEQIARELDVPKDWLTVVDGKLNVTGPVTLSPETMVGGKLKYKFGKTGSFNCSILTPVDGKALATLENFPDLITGSLTIFYADLANLENFPHVQLGTWFYGNLGSFKGLPDTINTIRLEITKLVRHDFKGLPTKVNGDLYISCENSEILSPMGLPSVVTGDLTVPRIKGTIKKQVEQVCHVSGKINYSY